MNRERTLYFLHLIALAKKKEIHKRLQRLVLLSNLTHPHKLTYTPYNLLITDVYKYLYVHTNIWRRMYREDERRAALFRIGCKQQCSIWNLNLATPRAVHTKLHRLFFTSYRTRTRMYRCVYSARTPPSPFRRHCDTETRAHEIFASATGPMRPPRARSRHTQILSAVPPPFPGYSRQS